VFKFALGNLTYHRKEKYLGILSDVQGKYWPWGDIDIYDSAFSSDEIARFTVIHETGHAFDFAATYRYGIRSWFVPPKSFDFINEFWGLCLPAYGACLNGHWYKPSGTVVNSYSYKGSDEDFANTFAAHVYKQQDWNLPKGSNQPDQGRLDIIKKWITLTVQNTPR